MTEELKASSWDGSVAFNRKGNPGFTSLSRSCKPVFIPPLHFSPRPVSGVLVRICYLCAEIHVKCRVLTPKARF